MMWWSDHGGWWQLMPLVMLAFWVAVIWLVVTLVRRSPTSASPHSSADAERTLAERYARGEIDEDEYRHRLDVVRQAIHVGEPR